MIPTPSDALCECGHPFAPNHQAPGAECFVYGCDCSTFKPKASLIADGSHLYDVLAREFWRCSGLAENAKHEAQKSDEVTRGFQEEYDKWQLRANEILAMFGGEWPENPLPGSVE